MTYFHGQWNGMLPTVFNGFSTSHSGKFMETQWDMEREMTKKMTRGCPEMIPNVWHFSVENNHEKCWFNGI